MRQCLNNIDKSTRSDFMIFSKKLNYCIYWSIRFGMATAFRYRKLAKKIQILKQLLFPRHSGTAFWTVLLITWATQLMWCFFTIIGTNAITARSCRKTSSSALTTTTSPCAFSGSRWSYNALIIKEI